jgi:hypothetical protein
MMRLKSVDRKAVHQFWKEAEIHENAQYEYIRDSKIDKDAAGMIERQFKRKQKLSGMTDDELANWRTLPHKRFFELLRFCLDMDEDGNHVVATTPANSLTAQIGLWTCPALYNDEEPHNVASQKLYALCDLVDEYCVASDEKRDMAFTLSNTLKNKLTSVEWKKTVTKIKSGQFKPTTPREVADFYFEAYSTLCATYRVSKEELPNEFPNANKRGKWQRDDSSKGSQNPNGKKKQRAWEPRGKKQAEGAEPLNAVTEPKGGKGGGKCGGKGSQPTGKPGAKPNGGAAKPQCKGCGRRDHHGSNPNSCLFRDHPNWNDSSHPWN